MLGPDPAAESCLWDKKPVFSLFPSFPHQLFQEGGSNLGGEETCVLFQFSLPPGEGWHLAQPQIPVGRVEKIKSMCFFKAFVCVSMGNSDAAWRCPSLSHTGSGQNNSVLFVSLAQLLSTQVGSLDLGDPGELGNSSFSSSFISNSF